MQLSRPIRTALPCAVAFTLLAAARPSGCGRDAPTAAVLGADTTITVAPGAGAFPFGDVFRLSFLEVRTDSRCPVDVVCVWQGDAEVEIGVRLGMGPTVPYVLHTGVAPRSIIYGIYRVTLVSLEPAPLSTATIPAGDYRATLRVERFGND